LEINFDIVFYNIKSIFSQNQWDLAPDKVNKFNLENSGWEFIENKGQFVYPDGEAANDIIFVAQKGSFAVYLRESGLSYIITKDNTSKRIDFDFRSCNNTLVYAEEEYNDYINYYLPQCPDGILNVKKYGKVIYKNLYDNIDLIFYTNPDGALQYDFIINPSGNPSDIAFSTVNPEHIKIEDDELIIESDYGHIIHSRPYTYQLSNDGVGK
jgi:hypothetical protein